MTARSARPRAIEAAVPIVVGMIQVRNQFELSSINLKEGYPNAGVNSAAIDSRSARNAPAFISGRAIRRISLLRDTISESSARQSGHESRCLATAADASSASSPSE
jgi:hypothetical protein